MRQPDSPDSTPNLTLPHFIDAAPSPAHAVSHCLKLLRASGCQLVDARQPWQLAPGKVYAQAISERSLIAFRLPRQSPQSFAIVGAHSDSPCLRLRERSLQWDAGLLVTGCEVYGGAINATWLDRPLRVAGTVALRTDSGLSLHLIEISAVQAVIPNLAIHLNRDINKGFEYNPHQHLRALVSLECPAEYQKTPWEYLAAEQLGRDLGHPVAVADIAGLDLYLADAQAAQTLGAGQSLINAPRLDNLAGCHAGLSAFLTAQAHPNAVQVLCLFDHEEIGSRSAAGADSTILGRCLRRIGLAGGLSAEQDFYIALENSMIASVDAAHAQHPNFPDKHDQAYAPKLGGGIALKSNVNQRYATTVLGAARLIQICADHGLALQRFTNKADTACGSTIGPALAAMTGIAAFDLGIPLLAMHSCRETASLGDQAGMIKALKAFWEEY